MENSTAISKTMGGGGGEEGALVAMGDVPVTKEHSAREDRLTPFPPSTTLVYWHAVCCGAADKGAYVPATCHHMCMQPPTLPLPLTTQNVYRTYMYVCLCT